VKAGQNLSKINKETALHTAGTAQVSAWNGSIFLILPRKYTKIKVIVEFLQ
jgi:hypothetical protein